MIRVTAASHYLHPVCDGEALPDLGTELKSVCREPFRRIDRFIQLALVGTGRCVEGRTLDPSCGFYLGSGLGPMGNNIDTQQQLVRDRLIPKPFNFINTLGNSAGYYVAKNLSLSGQNLFISRRGASFTAVLEAALVDIECGALVQALVGVVEEVTLPLAEHRRRQGLAVNTAVAEGSHWLLLEKDATTGPRIEYGSGAHRQAAAPKAMPFHDSIAAAEVTERLVRGEVAELATEQGLYHFRP